MRKYIKIKNEALGVVTTVKLPFTVNGVIVSPNANTTDLDEIIFDACQCRPSNISDVYRVQVIEVVGVDTTGLNFDTVNYAELKALISELNARAQA